MGHTIYFKFNEQTTKECMAEKSIHSLQQLCALSQGPTVTLVLNFHIFSIGQLSITSMILHALTLLTDINNAVKIKAGKVKVINQF